MRFHFSKYGACDKCKYNIFLHNNYNMKKNINICQSTYFLYHYIILYVD